MRMPAINDDLLLMIDTGFNGDLMLSRAGAHQLDLSVSGETSAVVLGDGSSVFVHLMRATVDWLSVHRAVEVLVSDSWLPAADEPLGLLGTRLLTPHLLLVDFAERTVEIETSE